MNINFYVVVANLALLVVSSVTDFLFDAPLGNPFLSTAAAIAGIVCEIVSMSTAYSDVVYVNDSDKFSKYARVLRKKWFRRPKIHEYVVPPGGVAFFSNSEIIDAKNIVAGN